MVTASSRPSRTSPSGPTAVSRSLFFYVKQEHVGVDPGHRVRRRVHQRAGLGPGRLPLGRQGPDPAARSRAREVRSEAVPVPNVTMSRPEKNPAEGRRFRAGHVRAGRFSKSPSRPSASAPRPVLPFLNPMTLPAMSTTPLLLLILLASRSAFGPTRLGVSRALAARRASRRRCIPCPSYYGAYDRPLVRDAQPVPLSSPGSFSSRRSPARWWRSGCPPPRSASCRPTDQPDGQRQVKNLASGNIVSRQVDPELKRPRPKASLQPHRRGGPRRSSCLPWRWAASRPAPDQRRTCRPQPCRADRQRS